MKGNVLQQQRYMSDSFKFPTETEVTKAINTSRYPTSANRTRRQPQTRTLKRQLPILSWNDSRVRNKSHQGPKSPLKIIYNRQKVFRDHISLHFPFHEMSPGSFQPRGWPTWRRLSQSTIGERLEHTVWSLTNVFVVLDWWMTREDGHILWRYDVTTQHSSPLCILEGPIT